MQFLIALDQVFNTLIWLKGDGFGYADETLSARAWRLRGVSNGWKVINALFFWQANHCRDSYRRELSRHHLPADYRKKEPGNGQKQNH